MDFPLVLAQFGDAIGLSDLKLDADNCCTLLFDAAHEITFTLNAEDDAVLLHCEMGQASALRSREELAALMQASLLGAKTGGAAFSIHEGLDQLVLWKRYTSGFVEREALERAVNDFLAYAVYWKKQLSEGGAREEQETVPLAEFFAAQSLRV